MKNWLRRLCSTGMATAIIAATVLVPQAGVASEDRISTTRSVPGWVVPGWVGDLGTRTSTDLIPDTRPRSVTPRAYVAFGDSFAANPEMPLQVVGLATRQCLRGDQGYPERVGREVFDGDYTSYACNNATLGGTAGRGIIEMVHQAQTNGDIGPETQLVTLGVSGADDWNPQLGGLPDFGAFLGADNVTEDAWVTRMIPVMESIRQAAPNARVLFVGYPEIGDGRGGVCVINISDGINGSSDINLPVAVPVRIEELLDTINTHAAANEHLGYEFISTDVPGTGSCAHPSHQWVRSIIDLPGAGDGLRIPVHPTALGERAVADIIKEQL